MSLPGRAHLYTLTGVVRPAGGFCACRRKKYGCGNHLPKGESGCRLFYFTHNASTKEENSIAIYHLSIKIISRGKGKSAVAAAAYRAGEKITNQYDGITHDYTRKGGVAYTEILLPDNAPPEFSDRATLWNAVEQIEKNKNSQLSREIEIALPVELTQEQNVFLVREYCQQHFVSAGMCADIAIHDKNDGNPHAHVMLTMRPFAQDGSWEAKCKKEYILNENGEKITLPSGEYKSRKVDATAWNDQGKAEVWRQGWADICNQYLEQNSVAERIDHRSYERQGVEQIPTVHLGVAAFQMEKRGIRTERGDINRQVQLDNKMLRQLRARINKLKSGLDELLAEAAPHPAPSINLADVLTDILEKPEEKTRRQRITDLKTFARAVAFVQQNNIADVQGLRDKVAGMYGRLSDVNDQLKLIERRLKTLDKHIESAEGYFQNQALYKQYQRQKPKNQADFYERHRAGLMTFEAAREYLKQHMNGRTEIPVAKWKAEAAALTSQRETLYRDYTRLKGEVRDAEVIRRCVEAVIKDGARVKRQDKKQEIEI